MYDLTEMTGEISQWNKENLADLKARLKALNVKHSKNSPNQVPLIRALKSQLHKDAGLIDRITYKMPRSAIFLHKGVSKGHPISNPRTAKEWYVPVVEKNIEKLQDIIANGAGNLIINNFKFQQLQ